MTTKRGSGRRLGSCAAALAVFFFVSARAHAAPPVGDPPPAVRMSLVPERLVPSSQASAPAEGLPAAPAPTPPVYQRWWFWTAVGAAAVGVVVLVLAAGDEQDPPASQLGNMDATLRRP